MSAPTPRFVIGIDLGTTHTVVSFADLQSKAPRPQVFAIPQLVAPGEVEALALLPSCRYHPSPAEAAGSDDEAIIVGEYARRLASKTPGRVVTSAKSWLCHRGVDRNAPILPWGAGDDVPTVSPVEASASYLRHVRDAWNAQHPDARLEAQEVVLTVPASFDEVARALTLQAAESAGLAVRLVEEPQAAFHSFLDANRADLPAVLGDTRLVLVVDVGGGTTDLTLVQVEMRENEDGALVPRLSRTAVGEHLLLGGDNMDVALAREVEPLFGDALSASRFQELVQQCRLAKEDVLSDSRVEDAVAEGSEQRMSRDEEEIPLTLLGAGSRLVASARTVRTSRKRARQLLLDGFFPECPPEAELGRSRQGLIEFGLPYVADARVSVHLASFLREHSEIAARAFAQVDARPAKVHPSNIPDAVLLNGGVFRSELLSERLVSILSAWRGEPVRCLPSASPDVAVAQGAVAYALARRGVGFRIGGGSARTYSLVLSGSKDAVCLLSRGAEEGETVRLPDRTFRLKLGAPVQFVVAASTSEVKHVAAGDLHELDDSYRSLPPLSAVLAAEGNAEVSVELEAGMSDFGTLMLSCVAANGRAWKLEWPLRGEASLDVLRVGSVHARFAEARERILAVYGKAKDSADVATKDVKQLRSELERILGPRETWGLPLLRELFSALHTGMKHRRRTADHERVFFNLVGYALRPGTGHPIDEWRVRSLVEEVLKGGVQFAPEPQNWAEYWTMWRRVAGGLVEADQMRLAQEIEWSIEVPGKKPRPKQAGPKRLGLDDMIRLAGSLERLPMDTKERLGGHLLARTTSEASPAVWWSLGRIGARVPSYGSAHRVLRTHVVQPWLDTALACDLRKTPDAAFSCMLMARASGDRERDFDDSVRARVASALSDAGHLAWAEFVRSPRFASEAEERKISGDSLPPGLRLVG